MVTGIAVGSAVAIIGALANYFVSRYQVEHQVRYTHWYSEQAKVVAELYKRVVETERNLKAWAGPFGINSQEQREAAGVSYNDLYHYYHTTSIWLNQSVCESLDSFLSEAAIFLATSTYCPTQTLRVEHGIYPTTRRNSARCDALSTIRFWSRYRPSGRSLEKNSEHS